MNLLTAVFLFICAFDAPILGDPAAPNPPAALGPAVTAGQTTTPGSTTPTPGSATDAANRAKLEAETMKLKEEAIGLERTNEALSVQTRRWTAWLTAGGSVLTVVSTLLIVYVGRSLNQSQRRKLEQERDLGQEKHLLEVFKELGSVTPRVRLGAAAILVQRVEKLVRERTKKTAAAEIDDLPTIAKLLVASTKKEDEVLNQKYVGDNLAKALGAIVSEETAADKAGTAADKIGTPADQIGRSPLRDYDFQSAGLRRVWWERINARKVDFYYASFAQAGLSKGYFEEAVLIGCDLSEATLNDGNFQGAKLQTAILRIAKLKRTNLTKADLTRADLTGANLEGANLSGADLTEANLERANLTGAKLHGAIVKSANFKNATLTGIEPPDFDFSPAKPV